MSKSKKLERFYTMACTVLDREDRAWHVCCLTPDEAGKAVSALNAVEKIRLRIAELEDALRSWEIGDDDCGCDTAMCQGLCAPAKTRDALSSTEPPKEQQ